MSCVAPSGGGAVAGAAAEEVRRRALRLRGCALCGRPRQGARARRPRPHGARTQIRGRRRADSTVRMLTLTADQWAAVWLRAAATVYTVILLCYI